MLAPSEHQQPGEAPRAAAPVAGGLLLLKQERNGNGDACLQPFWVSGMEKKGVRKEKETLVSPLTLSAKPSPSSRCGIEVVETPRSADFPLPLAVADPSCYQSKQRASGSRVCVPEGRWRNGANLGGTQRPPVKVIPAGPQQPALARSSYQGTDQGTRCTIRQIFWALMV